MKNKKVYGPGLKLKEITEEQGISSRLSRFSVSQTKITNKAEDTPKHHHKKIKSVNHEKDLDHSKATTILDKPVKKHKKEKKESKEVEAEQEDHTEIIEAKSEIIEIKKNFHNNQSKEETSSLRQKVTKGSKTANSDEAAAQKILDAKLLKAATKGHHKKIEPLLEQGADINAQDKNGDTPLHHAARHSPPHYVTMKILIENYANDQCKNDAGKTFTEELLPRDQFFCALMCTKDQTESKKIKILEAKILSLRTEINLLKYISVEHQVSMSGEETSYSSD